MKNLKESVNNNGYVKYNDIYSLELDNFLEVNVYDKELYEKLREEDLVLFQKGEYDGINWSRFQDEISYLRDDMGASDFSMQLHLANGILIIDIVYDKDKDIVMEYRLTPMFLM